MNPNETINPAADEIASLEAQIAGIDVTKLDPNDNGKIISPVVETKQQPVGTQVETPATPTEDPIKTELDRVKGQTQGKTPQEKFEYKLKRELAQAKEMGIDIASLAGVKTEPEEVEEEKPLTRKDLEAILKTQTSTKTAVSMAMELENEAERELHLHYLENKVNPNLTEEEKFQTAKDMVDAIKFKNQINLTSLKPQASSHSTASSFQPSVAENFGSLKLTAEENYIFQDAQKRGYPLTKEEIVEMRK